MAENKKRPQGVGVRGRYKREVSNGPYEGLRTESNYEYIKALRSRKGEIIRRWKADRGCQRCGESHPATLDLHHRDPAKKHPRLKRKNASTTRRTGGYFWRDLSINDLAAELAKCTVLCSNCHRIVEWELRGEITKGGDDPPPVEV